jgi:phosphatidylglycerophosphate synthase
MGSKFRLRIIFRPLIRYMAKKFSRIGVTANMATIFMLVLSILSFCSLFFFSNLFWFAICVFLTGIFDGLDGAIARLNNKTTSFGSLFDSIMDRFSEFFIFLALLINRWNAYLWHLVDMKIIIMCSFIASLMISYLRSRAEILYDGDFDIGLMGRSERLFFIVVSALLANFIGFLDDLLFLFLILVIFTAIYRFIKIQKMIKD